MMESHLCYGVDRLCLRGRIDIFAQSTRSVLAIEGPEFGKVLVAEIGTMGIGAVWWVHVPSSSRAGTVA